MDSTLLGLVVPQFASVPLQVSDLPDSIAEAFWGWLVNTLIAVATELSTALTDELLKSLLEVPNPHGSTAAGSAWNGMFEISLVLLPIMIALALIAWPFSEDRESGLMDLIVRTVMVLLFIGISQPAWGFAIDATNAVTLAILNLDPDPGMANYGYGSGLVGAPATFSTWALKFIVSIVAALLAVLALLLALFFLLLRWFMIWMAYIGTPFFAVVWFVGRGPLKSVGSVGATFMRMGVFALLGGPVIAIIVLAFQVIEHGGILQATGSSGGGISAVQNFAGEVGLIFAELALMLLFPVILIVAVWKLISWAGQPIGVGEAATVATMAVTAAVGGAGAGAGDGAGAAGSGSTAGGSGGAAAGGSASAGSTMGSSSAAASGSGASAGSAGSANVGAGGSGLSSRMTARAKGAVNNVKQSAHEQATKRIGHYGTSEKLDTAQASLTEAQADHETASSQAKFIQNAMASEEMDMAEAKKQGFLDAEPMENQEPKFKTDPDTLDRKMSYIGTDGASRSVNLTQKFRTAKADEQDASERITAAETGISMNSARNRRVETGKKGTRTGKKAGTFTAKTGAAAMVGGVGGNSYLAYSMGRRAGGPMISSNGPQETSNSNHRLSDFGKASAGQSQAAKSGDIGSETSSGNDF